MCSNRKVDVARCGRQPRSGQNRLMWSEIHRCSCVLSLNLAAANPIYPGCRS
ncbi:hypothetical protein Hanom_Chr04g00376931 [Helianthus anomalus]